MMYWSGLLASNSKIIYVIILKFKIRPVRTNVCLIFLIMRLLHILVYKVHILSAAMLFQAYKGTYCNESMIGQTHHLLVGTTGGPRLVR